MPSLEQEVFAARGGPIRSNKSRLCIVHYKTLQVWYLHDLAHRRLLKQQRYTLGQDLEGCTCCAQGSRGQAPCIENRQG